MPVEISLRKIAHVILQAREDRSARELHDFIDAMNEDEQAQLVAIAWIGRGAFEAEDFETALSTAYTERSSPTPDYLMGMPHLAENLEAGLEALDFDVSEIEEDFFDR